MTRRRIALQVPNNGYWITPEFNGDRSEFIQNGSKDSCDLDWDGIAAIFKGVWDITGFEIANSVAQTCYHSSLVEAPALPITHVRCLASISCDEIYLVGSGEMIKVETSKSAATPTAEVEGDPQHMPQRIQHIRKDGVE